LFLSHLSCHSRVPSSAPHSFPTRRSSDLGFDAKKAAAFPKNALSASSSWTRRRRLFSSSRSVAANGASGPGAGPGCAVGGHRARSEEHTSELQSRFDLVCRLLLEKKKCIK